LVNDWITNVYATL